MDPVVRRAEAFDRDDLVRLELLAREAALEFRGGALLVAEVPVTDWAAVLADPRAHVLVGTLDDVVCAFLLLGLASDRSIVSHVFVEEEARELGLGDTLIEHAVEITRAAGLAGIEGVALPGDRATKNLFERAGLTARKITVYKAL